MILTVAPGGAETLVFQLIIFPENAGVIFPFDTPGMRIWNLILNLYQVRKPARFKRLIRIQLFTTLFLTKQEKETKLELLVDIYICHLV